MAVSARSRQGGRRSAAWGFRPSSPRSRKFLVPVLLVAVLLALTGCISIVSITLPTNVEAGSHYTMTLRVKTTSDVTSDGRLAFAFRVPNQWSITSVKYAGAKTGLIIWSSSMTAYFTDVWSTAPVDAAHSGAKAGYKWWAGYSSGNLNPLTAEQWADITVVVNTNSYSGAFSLDFVLGTATWANPTVKASNNNGANWENGPERLNQAVTLLPTVKPFVVSTDPPAGSVNVAASVSPTVTFSEAMDTDSFGGNIYVRENGGATVAAATSYNPATKTFTVNPAADLAASTAYQIVVKAGVKDAAGNTMAADFVVGFTTAAPTPVAPQLILQLPAPGAVDVSVGTIVTAAFDQDMDDTSIDDGAYYLMKSGSPTKVPAVITYVPASKQAVIDPVADLDPGTDYTVNLRSGVKGLNGLSVQGTPIVWTFTTAGSAPVGPQVIQQLPAPGDVGVPVASLVMADFDQDMDASTITDAVYYLTKSGSPTKVPAVITYVAATRRAVIDPVADLDPGTEYTVNLRSGVKGANTLALQGTPVIWSFTTAAPPPPPTFPDVPPGHPYHDAIQGMADLHIINGYTNGNFGPGDPVRRWHFAKMIVGALSLPTFESDTSPFTDLDADDVTAIDMTEFVAVAYKNGITNGTTATTYGPYTYINRTQVVTMVVRAIQGFSPSALAAPPAGYTNEWGTGYSSIHGPLARIAEYNGLLEGIDLDGVAHDPWSQMPRGEVAQILWNMMDLLDLR